MGQGAIAMMNRRQFCVDTRDRFVDGLDVPGHYGKTLIWTRRNLTVPAMYCSAIGPLVNWPSLA